MFVCLSSSPVFAAITTDQIDWTISSTNVVDLFAGNSSDGSITLYSQLNNTRTGFDIGPTRGTLPTSGPLAEMVIYRTTDQATNYERMSFTAHTSSPTGFNIDIENGGTGVARDLNFITNTIEAMKLNSSGNLWIGHTANDVGNNTRARHALVFEQHDPSANGSYDSHFIQWTGKSKDGGGNNNADWRAGCDITADDGTSDFIFQHRNGGDAFVTKMAIGDDGDVEVMQDLVVNGVVNLDSSTLTVSSNTITITKSFHTIDCSSAQTINTINSGVDGDVVTFIKSGANNCTFADAGTNVQTGGGFTLDATNDTIFYL